MMVPTWRQGAEEQGAAHGGSSSHEQYRRGSAGGRTGGAPRGGGNARYDSSPLPSGAGPLAQPAGPGHVEMLTTMLARLLEGAPGEATEMAAAANPVLAAVPGGMSPQHAIVSGGGALPRDSEGTPWNTGYIVASGNLLSDLRSNVAAEALSRLMTSRVYNMTDDRGVHLRRRDGQGQAGHRRRRARPGRRERGEQDQGSARLTEPHRNDPGDPGSLRCSGGPLRDSARARAIIPRPRIRCRQSSAVGPLSFMAGRGTGMPLPPEHTNAV